VRDTWSQWRLGLPRGRKRGRIRTRRCACLNTPSGVVSPAVGRSVVTRSKPAQRLNLAGCRVSKNVYGLAANSSFRTRRGGVPGAISEESMLVDPRTPKSCRGSHPEETRRAGVPVGHVRCRRRIHNPLRLTTSASPRASRGTLPHITIPWSRAVTGRGRGQGYTGEQRHGSYHLAGFERRDRHG